MCENTARLRRGSVIRNGAARFGIRRIPKVPVRGVTGHREVAVELGLAVAVELLEPVHLGDLLELLSLADEGKHFGWFLY